MLIDAHVHLDKYGDRLDDALKEIANEKIFTVATAMDVPSYLELQEIAERSNPGFADFRYPSAPRRRLCESIA